MSGRGDAKKAISVLESLGWRVAGGGGKHYRCFPPDGGKPVAVTCSPTDPRAAWYFQKLVNKARRTA